MLISRIVKFVTPSQPLFIVPMAFSKSQTHRKSCPAAKTKRVCPGKGGLKKTESLKRGPVCAILKKKDSGDGGSEGLGLKRALKPGKCRMGFIPEEWFLFFRPMTGVSGPYMFMLGVGNYLVSKEIYIMEHEYYLGISVLIVLYIVTTRLGPKVGAILDKEVDAEANELEKGRSDELAGYAKNVKDAETAIWRAEGQKDLMDAKKENISIQLEAIYRERLMTVYLRVRNRMDYHVRRHSIENRVHQKWMVKWILDNVQKSITPEFKIQAMSTAIRDLGVLAARSQK